MPSMFIPIFLGLLMRFENFRGPADNPLGNKTISNV